jgi:hypothetical protein
MTNPLDNSRPLDLHATASDKAVDLAIDTLFGEISARHDFAGNKAKFKSHLRVLTMDLYKRFREDPDGYLQYPRNANKFGASARYNPLGIKYTNLIKAADSLSDLGYADGVKGFYDKRRGGQSRESRIRATTKLIDLLTTTHGISPKAISTAEREVIVLRDKAEDKTKKEIAYLDTTETHRMRDVIKRYLAQLENTYIDVITKGYTPKEALFINLNDKFVRRIFNNSSWEEGGRFYGGWWQRIPRNLRERIVIFGKPTIEIDYSAIHIVFLYALECIDYFGEGRTDPYSIAGFPITREYRSLFKLVLLAVVNSADEEKARRAVQFEINKRESDFPIGVDLGEAIKAFESMHKAITPHFYSGIGTKLQFIDSQIAEKIMQHFLSSESISIPPLVIHDSFVVSKHAEAELREVMTTAFKDVLRTRVPEGCEVTPKTKDAVWIAYEMGKDESDLLTEIEEYVASPIHDSDQLKRQDVWSPGQVLPTLRVG